MKKFCERCGDTGTQPAGIYNPDTDAYDAPAGPCQDCFGHEGLLKLGVLDMVETLVAKFLYYDRKGDEDCPVGLLEKAVAAGVVSADEIVAKFGAELRKRLDV